ncbi:hypothetical protein CYMTET_24408 [Cymbomonas tetramitiformis]|uniref:PH domain-containing protein n=1 Tax=Cymbomonas tetramitiformis TaxID=36881 RepID=A0AAE0L099_9CHLO|nr:hypothetical protein CYMTET_24408 [Cymbomonas tetramitiformis]
MSDNEQHDDEISLDTPLISPSSEVEGGGSFGKDPEGKIEGKSSSEELNNSRSPDEVLKADGVQASSVDDVLDSEADKNEPPTSEVSLSTEGEVHHQEAIDLENRPRETGVSQDEKPGNVYFSSPSSSLSDRFRAVFSRGSFSSESPRNNDEEPEDEVPCSAAAGFESSPAFGANSDPSASNSRQSVYGNDEDSGTQIGERRADFSRHKETILLLHDEAEKEENRLSNFASLMCSRMDSGRTACEAMARLLKGMAATEGSYSKACTKMSQTAVLSEGGDGSDSLFAACEAAGVLPRAAAAAHRAVEESLLGAAGEVTSCSEAASKESKALATAATERRKFSEKARAALMLALKSMETSSTKGWRGGEDPWLIRGRQRGLVCRKAGGRGGPVVDKRPSAGLVCRKAGGRGGPVVDKRPSAGACVQKGWRGGEDPWLMESLLLEQHSALQRAQEEGRAMLSTASERVMTLERQRVETLSAVLGTYVGAYQKLLAGLDESVSGMAGVLDCAREEIVAGGSQLSAAAHDAHEAVESMRAKQMDDLKLRTEELFNSPEIVRQGRMQWEGKVTGEWKDSIFVQTRSGHLHWFNADDDVVPMDGVKLSRCTIDAADPCVFSLTETGVGSAKNIFGKLGVGRRFTFQTGKAEECMEWVLSIKDAILDSGAKLKR